MSSLMETMDTTPLRERYVLQQKLGQGGMGTVYRATDRLTQESVALKQVIIPAKELQFASRASMGKSHNFRLALAQEFKTLASLRHPHIISVLDYGFDKQRQPYLILELLENAPTLFEVGRDQPLPKQVALLVQMLQALAYLHRRGIIHRDLKPDNVLVIEDQVKVLDFGLAVAREHLPEQTSDISGTLTYMAPEVLEGQAASEASDLYAVGVMAYELLVGQHPFDTTNFALLAMDISTKIPDTHTLGLDERLASILDRLLAKTPDARYGTVREVITALTEAINQPNLAGETRAMRESFLQAAQFVGREAEFGRLVEALKGTVMGQGSAWLVGGESGVGKSRLLEELRTQALVAGALVLPGQAISEGGQPYQVWREVVRHLCLESTLSDLEAGVLKTLAPDIGRLLDRNVADAPAIAPQAAYERLLRVMAEVVQRHEQPLVVILEDLHWSGAESLALLERLSQGIDQSALLLLASYRDDERPDLPAALPTLQPLTLPRLTAERITTLSESMLGAAGREPELVKLLQQETEGNIFFIVEVVRALAEEVGQLDQIGQIALPRTVFAGGMQAVIERRLQRVPAPAYPLLQVMAVAGRQIDANLLRSLAAKAAKINVALWLDECALARVLEVHDGRWRFAHDKLREGVLLKLSLAEQKGLHRQVAEAIEQVYEADLSPFYPRLAYHWSQVVFDKFDKKFDEFDKKFDKIEEDQADPQLVSKAIDYLQKAGEQAARNYASQEAVAFFNEALILLKSLPETSERDRQELSLRSNLGQVLAVSKGFAAPEVGEAYTRALALGRQLEETAQITQGLYDLAQHALFRSELALAQTYGQECLRLTAESQDPELLLAVNQILSRIAAQLGQHAAAVTHYEQVVAFYRTHRPTLTFDEAYALAHTLAVMGSSLVPLGYPDRALREAQEGLALMQSQAHHFGTVYCLSILALTHHLRGEWRAALQCTEEAVAGANTHNFAQMRTFAQTYQGIVLTRLGEAEAGISLVRQATAEREAIGVTLGRTTTLARLAEACGQAGRVAEGLAFMGEALADMEAANERRYEPKTYQIKGDLLLLQDLTGEELAATQQEAEACFRRAIELAQSQEAKAKLWEARALASLCRLLESQGREEGCRQQLADLYAWFTEGFETEDLQVVQAVLQERA